MFTLSIREANQVRWSVTAHHLANALYPGIVYGTPPENASASNAATLIAGTRYRVMLSRIDELGNQVLAADTTFVK
jgi:hypothetical protein